MFPGLVLKGLFAWRALSKAQRRYVYENCVHRLLNSWRLKVVKTLFIFPALLFVMLGADPLDGLLIFAFNLFLLMFVVDELMTMLFISLNRKQIDSYIQTHAQEIAAV